MRRLAAFFLAFLAAAPLAAREPSRATAHDAASHDPLMRQIQRRLLRDGAPSAYAAVRTEDGKTVAVPLVDPLFPLRPVFGLRPEAASKTGPVEEAGRQLKTVDRKKSWK